LRLFFGGLGLEGAGLGLETTGLGLITLVLTTRLLMTEYNCGIMASLGIQSTRHDAAVVDTGQPFKCRHTQNINTTQFCQFYKRTNTYM